MGNSTSSFLLVPRFNTDGVGVAAVSILDKEHCNLDFGYQRSLFSQNLYTLVLILIFLNGFGSLKLRFIAFSRNYNINIKIIV